MIGAITSELRRALATLPVKALLGLRQEIQTSYLRWHRTTRGSARQEPLDALTEMRLARRLVDEAIQRLRAAGEGIETYASRIDGAPAQPPAAQPDHSSASGSSHSQAGPPDFDPVPYLPPAAPPRTRGGTYTKTRGNYVRGNRVEELVSGEHDHYSAQVNQHARRLGLVELQTAGDVELRFAMRMREEKMGSATILLNRAPCKGRLGCDSLLSRFLPPRATLTVYWPDPETTYRHKTYRGGE
ncbi:DddA-like double-stranded DNA deaminase toxin [Plantactinospora endophytica]|uniref:SCP1.201-like deaminase n=1 Tax=Plantactinospora endophytica TaxID=673535 RepID=A0ABQ4E340_9ACTN|nr:DddA-like double-stranded DNA deaminase toxin [Plantactinospora endophytica]GIG89129.1 hypothetical protein Pen02_40650 [Plantactinospora endophytica]